MKIFDKQIHKDEFKLRLLLTNGCNKNCGFCLNDFQEKPKGEPLFLDTGVALTAIATYSMSIHTGAPLQVYFSGGEPTLHRDFAILVQTALNNKCRVTVNTNGTFPATLDGLLFQVPCLHFGVYAKDHDLRARIKLLNGSVQCVYSVRYPYVDFSFVEFYLSHGIPVKVFGDLREDQTEYRVFAERLVAKYTSTNLSFRFTGVQENRGMGCNNCDRYCVTLKGAWVFPDGGTSHCPQQCKGEVYYPGTHGMEWIKALNRIKELHKV